MTLDNLECQNRSFYGFFCDFELRHAFPERIAPTSLVIYRDSLHMKFSALNVDFDCSSVDFLGSRKPAHEGIKQRTFVRVVILPLLASLSWKQLQIGMGMLLITTSTSEELFICININDYERPWTFKIRVFCQFLRSLAAAHTLEWIVMKWLEIDWQFANRNCYRL